MNGPNLVITSNDEDVGKSKSQESFEALKKENRKRCARCLKPLPENKSRMSLKQSQERLNYAAACFYCAECWNLKKIEMKELSEQLLNGRG